MLQRCAWIEYILVALFFLVLTLIATYPAAIHFNDYFIGKGDALQNAWNLWWVHHSITHYGDFFPFHTKMVYHPDGVSLAYHTLGLFNGWLATPLQILGFSLPTTHNIIVVLTFVLTGTGMYLLIHSQTGSRTAALLAGIIFTFAPIRMSRVGFGNLQVYSTQFIPVMVWALIAMNEQRRFLCAGIAALCLALTGWSSLEGAFMTGVLALALFPSSLITSKGRVETIKGWILFGTLTVIFMLPVVLPMIQAAPEFQHIVSNPSFNNADALGFILPDHHFTPLVYRSFDSLLASVYATFYGNPLEKTVFVGYVVIAVVIVVLLAARSIVIWHWALVATLFLLLSFGPKLFVGGQPVLSHLPFEWFSHLPLVRFGRTPSRFALFLMFALAVLIGFGCRRLQQRWPRFRYATILLCLLVFVEFCAVPIRMDKELTRVPAFYDQLATADHTTPILDVPIDSAGAKGPGALYMLYQTVHKNPIVGGYVSREPAAISALFQRPFLHALRARVYNDREPFSFSSNVLAHAPADLQALDIDYVILHRHLLSESDAQSTFNALSTLLAEPVYADKMITVWQHNKK